LHKKIDDSINVVVQVITREGGSRKNGGGEGGKQTAHIQELYTKYEARAQV
jgi:hypothetical protein